MQTGLEIKKYLEENGITQAFLSRKTEIDPVKLNLGLNGKRRFTFEEYSFICGALGVNTDFFLKPRLPDEEVMQDERNITGLRSHKKRTPRYPEYPGV